MHWKINGHVHCARFTKCDIMLIEIGKFNLDIFFLRAFLSIVHSVFVPHGIIFWLVIRRASWDLCVRLDGCFFRLIRCGTWICGNELLFDLNCISLDGSWTIEIELDMSESSNHFRLDLPEKTNQSMRLDCSMCLSFLYSFIPTHTSSEVHAHIIDLSPPPFTSIVGLCVTIFLCDSVAYTRRKFLTFRALWILYCTNNWPIGLILLVSTNDRRQPLCISLLQSKQWSRHQSERFTRHRG